MRALLDINVLSALHDRDHVHHIRAATWFEANIHHWGVEHWEEFIMSVEAPGLLEWDASSPLPQPAVIHLPGEAKRLLQRLAHAWVVPWLDRLRPRPLTGHPHPLPPALQTARKHRDPVHPGRRCRRRNRTPSSTSTALSMCQKLR